MRGGEGEEGRSESADGAPLRRVLKAQKPLPSWQDGTSTSSLRKTAKAAHVENPLQPSTDGETCRVWTEASRQLKMQVRHHMKSQLNQQEWHLYMRGHYTLIRSHRLKFYGLEHIQDFSNTEVTPAGRAPRRRSSSLIYRFVHYHYHETGGLQHSVQRTAAASSSFANTPNVAGRLNSTWPVSTSAKNGGS